MYVGLNGHSALVESVIINGDNYFLGAIIWVNYINKVLFKWT